MQRFVDLTSAGPARLFGIVEKGRLAVGYDADFTVVDLKRAATITDDWIASRCGWTPYNGKTVTGWPIGTFVRGRRVMWEGEIVGARSGGAGEVRVRVQLALSGGRLRRCSRRRIRSSCSLMRRPWPTTDE